MNSAGVLQASQSYDAYGAQNSGGTPPGGFGFAGEQTDSSTGLQYLRARYYDPSIGRFISRDPMSAKPGWTGSPYGYGDANPLNITDPTGLCGGWLSAVCATNNQWFDRFHRADSAISSGSGFLGQLFRDVGLWSGQRIENYLDPVTVSGWVLVGATIWVGEACTGAMLTSGALAPACGLAISAFAAALAARYELLRGSGMTDGEIVCELLVDATMLAPGLGGAGLLESIVNNATQQAMGDVACSLVG